MRYDSGQFSSFDGRDNRKFLAEAFARLGRGLSEGEAAQQRAAFLRSLLRGSTSGFAGRPVLATPLSPRDAYLGFVALTGAFGVPVEEAAKLLEREVRKR